MDCGGASTQIAFEVPFKKQHREFRSLKLYGRFYNVFSRSYLCYGMNEAFNRYIMLLLRNQVSLVFNRILGNLLYISVPAQPIIHSVLQRKEFHHNHRLNRLLYL